MANNPDVSTRRRVKLYMLNEDRQWDDKGTGHVSATLIESNSMALVVISETDGSHLLESKIQHDTAYQKQQETLIVWSEGDNIDLALSFQEKTGCDDIWEKICNVQGKDPSVDITQDLIDETDDGDDMEDSSTASGNTTGLEFPTCDLVHLPEISEMFTQVINYPLQRDRIATALERSQYMKQLIDLFHKAEDLEDEKALHNLYEITRAIIQLNRRSLYDMIFSEDLLMDIVGMLEYNPTKRMKHRDFISAKSNFKEIIPLNSALKTKIHQTYRVQYIQDNCLPPPSLFDDNAGSSLHSFIYLNKIEIITKLQDDNQFLQQLFGKLLLPELSVENRLDLLGLLKEFCAIVNSLQQVQKESFFNSLCQNKALKSIFYSFKSVNDIVKSHCVDILQIFVENQPSVVREFFVNDSRENSGESLYLNILIDHLINDLDSELSTGFLIMNMLKVLLDPENMINTGQKNEKQEFLNFFYKNCMQHLTQPLEDLTNDNELKYDDYHTAMVMHDIVELMAFCVEFHSYHMKNFAFNNNILLRVVTLFKSQHKFVVLAALRVIRKFIASKEDFNYRFIIKNNVLCEVINLLDSNRRYNMINSAVLELFEFIRTENIPCLISHVGELHWDRLQHHNYVNTFELLKTRYDQLAMVNLRVTPPLASSVIACQTQVGGLMTTSTGLGASLVAVAGSSTQAVLQTPGQQQSRPGGRRESRSLMDDDEEQWYDQDEEEDDDMINSPTTALYSTSATFIERYARHKDGSTASTTSSTGVNSTEDGTCATTTAAGSSNAAPFKLSASRFSRDPQQISINIKSTTLTLGSGVSSTTEAVLNESSPVENGTLEGGADNETELAVSTTSERKSSGGCGDIGRIENGVVTMTETEDDHVNHISSSDSHSKVDTDMSGETVLTTGLVDYEDDEEEEEDSSRVGDRKQSVVGVPVSVDASAPVVAAESKDATEWECTSPKRLKLD